MLLLPTVVLAKDDPPSSTQPQVVTSGNVACGSGSPVTCTTEVSSVTSLPVTVNVSNGQNTSAPQTYPVVGTITGSGGLSDPSTFLFFYGSFGQQPNDTFPSLAYVQGSPVSLTNSAQLTFVNALASGATYYLLGTANDGLTGIYAAEGGGVLVAYSHGGDGFPDNVDSPNAGNFNGAQGGPVTITNAAGASLTVLGNGGGGPALTGIAGYSIGGTGAENKTGDTDYAGNGGDGGSVTVINDGLISMANTGGVETYGILVLSEGGVGNNEKNYAIGDGGSGGTVTVTNAGSIVNSASNGIGIVAVSVGGASNFADKDGGADASGAGDGGSVSVEIANGGSIAMTGGIGIGVMALSTGGAADNGWEGKGGPVSVTVDQGGVIDTTGSGQSLSIGILAASAGSTQDVLPFASSTVSTAWPGTPGDVTVTNDGTITSAGSMAIGIAALSIGGASIVTNATASGNSYLGDVSTGYGSFSGETATVVNNGRITTLGGAAFGVLALSSGGGGGLLNLDGAQQSATVGGSTSGSENAGNGAAVSVTNAGSITTGDGNGGGRAAIGIVAQSIGGGGGSSNAPAFFVGGHDTEGSGGGAGGAVTVTTQAGSEITTHDSGALGILAQSIGGGGGNGANAAGIFVAVGGNGGNGGNGGSVTVDLTNSGSGGITTMGDFAAGAIAQSVGGGGGNGGYADTAAPVISAAIGGAGGSGGAGGAVSVTNVATITTGGNQALGMLAQSIGGGGGNGGAATAYSAGVGLSVSLAVGGIGGGGGDGGTVSITNDYHIHTGCASAAAGCSYANAGGPLPDGADSIGILAQSIGGGGGNGGAATATSLALPSDEVPTISIDFALGGGGAVGGSGDGVTIANAGEVFTAGDGSHSILAQSIGGGGGNGGDSTASAYALEGTTETLKASVALGGSGGAAGDGGPVTVTNGQSASCGGCNAQIVTVGQNAVGILAQSIGGGGGTGGTGNASASSPNLGDETGTAIDVAFAVGGGGGSGGDGNTVSVTNDAGSLIGTVGSGSQGILAQSIGGGGGLAGAGCSNSVQAGPLNNTASACLGNGGAGISGSSSIWNDSSDITLDLGGADGAYGNGDSVTVSQASGAIVTSGARAFGIAAQSIGGGGGLAAGAETNVTQVNLRTGEAGNGGSIAITLGAAGADPAGASITTYGDGAFGMLAQSIGGGGGFGGDSSLPIGSMRANFLTASPINSDTINGGDITISLNGNIATSGSNAHGIFVQSVGGGGGTYGDDGQLMVGNDPGAGVASYNGSGGAITIVQDSGTIATSGQSSIGIFAQSTGNYAGNQRPIDITVGGAVLGGSGSDATGILTSGGASGSGGANIITINAGGSISTQDGVDGLAIGSGYGLTSVVNDGTITGSIDLNVGGTGEGSVSGSGTQANAAASTLATNATPPALLAALPRGSIVNNGTIIAGTRIAAASVTNAGTLDVGGGGRIATTSIGGDFVQTATGELRLDVDSLTGTADRLEIAGNAKVAGRITPLAQSLLPGTMTVLSAKTLTLSATPLDNGGLVFDWQANNDGRQLTLSPAADFTPTGASLSPNQAAAAMHLQKIWDAGASERSADLFGAFSGLTSPGQLRSALDSIAPPSLSNDAIAQASASRAALGAMMSCPEFAGESVMLSDGRCLWAKVTAGYEDQDVSSDTGGYRVDRWTFRAGAQTPLAPDWFLGVTAAYSNSSADSDGSSWRSDGDGADVGVAVKYMPGQWQFAAALDLGYGWYDQRRSVVVGGLRQQLKSSPDVLTIAGRLRAAYQVPFERLYLKPYVDLDLIHSRVQSYQEHGGDLALDVRSQEHTSLELSPMLELGGRLDLARRTILRPYAAVGLTVPSDNSWNSKASLDSAPAGTDSFTTSTRSPSLYGNLDLGLQLYQGDSIDLKLEYGLRIGDGYTAQYGGGRVAYRF